METTISGLGFRWAVYLEGTRGLMNAVRDDHTWGYDMAQGVYKYTYLLSLILQVTSILVRSGVAPAKAISQRTQIQIAWRFKWTRKWIIKLKLGVISIYVCSAVPRSHVHSN